MNPYKVLEVSENASSDEIRKSYRKLARKYHPDSNPGDKNAEEKFKEINDAYTILSDEGKKAEYDRKASQRNTGNEKAGKAKNPFGQGPFAGSPFGGFPFGQNPFGENPFEPEDSKEKTKTDFGYGVDKESINNQFASFFGFNAKK